MDRLQALKSLAHGEEIEKGANLADILDIGMTALMLHNTLHGRASDDDGSDFDKSDLDGLLGALNKSEQERPPAKDKTGLLQQLKAMLKSKEAPAPEGDSADTLQFRSTPMDGEKIASEFLPQGEIAELDAQAMTGLYMGRGVALGQIKQAAGL